MESTGNYWITLYDRLTATGIDVYLVNARHVKEVPGKKTDGCDAQWFQQLHSLGAVPGVGGGLPGTLMSELGTRDQILKQFASTAALSSWLGLNPDKRISGGKVLKAKTRKVASRLAKALRMGVFGLQKSNTKLGDYVRGMKARLGKAEGIVAGAHKLVRLIYGMIKNQKPYNESEAFKITPQPLAAAETLINKPQLLDCNSLRRCKVKVSYSGAVNIDTGSTLRVFSVDADQSLFRRHSGRGRHRGGGGGECGCGAAGGRGRWPAGCLGKGEPGSCDDSGFQQRVSLAAFAHDGESGSCGFEEGGAEF
jgi:hypothetical protein